MRWLLVYLVTFLVVVTCVPTLRRWGLGRLPGDLYFKVGKYTFEFPLMSTLVLAATIFLIIKFV